MEHEITSSITSSTQDFTSSIAPVNKIIPFSAVDGPGNRTAIFLQGCNINCQYCHNPETRALCNGCGACVATCPTGALTFGGTDGKEVIFSPAACVGCDTCITTCPNNASPKVLWHSASDVFAQVKRQLPFIRGITVSGGECMLYPAFLEKLFTLCKAAGLTTLIDSNGTIPFANYPDLMAVTDGVMLDIKAFHPADARTITGAENEIALQNAITLAQNGKLTELRTVVVPSLCNAAELIEQLAAHLSPHADLQSLRYKLIPYRPFGVRKAYHDLTPPTEPEMQTLAKLARKCGFGEVVVL